MIGPPVEVPVRLVRLTSVASESLRKLVGEVGRVEKIKHVAGATKLEVWFRVGWGNDREGFLLNLDEVEAAEVAG